MTAPTVEPVAEVLQGEKMDIDEDGPLHVWHELDEAGLREWASQYVGWATNEMSDPADLYWALNHVMPLDLVRDVGTDWQAYYLDEIEEGLRYDADFADADYHTPVVVSLENGQAIIWDGWHRLACAIHRGDRGIMAIVGRLPDGHTHHRGETSCLNPCGSRSST